MKKVLLCVLALFFVMNIVGCSSEAPFPKSSYIIQEDSERVLVRDDSDFEVLVSKKPQKVILLNNSLLDLWYIAGGAAIARVSGEVNVPQEAMNLKELGTMTNISIEELISLQPQLIVLADNIDAQQNMRPILEQSGIQVISLRYSTYQDTIDILKLFTSITAEEEIYKNQVLNLEKEVTEIVNKAPKDEEVSAVILFTSSQNIMVELEDTFTGDILKKMGGINIAKDGIPLDARPDKAAFSLEAIIAADPDVILFNTMGNIESAKEKIKKELEDNPAWAELRAVKEGRVYYLPREIFIFKPGINTAMAFEHIGMILYPEVFGNVKQ